MKLIDWWNLRKINNDCSNDFFGTGYTPQKYLSKSAKMMNNYQLRDIFAAYKQEEISDKELYVICTCYNEKMISLDNVNIAMKKYHDIQDYIERLPDIRYSNEIDAIDIILKDQTVISLYKDGLTLFTEETTYELNDSLLSDVALFSFCQNIDVTDLTQHNKASKAYLNVNEFQQRYINQMKKSIGVENLSLELNESIIKALKSHYHQTDLKKINNYEHWYKKQYASLKYEVNDPESYIEGEPAEYEAVKELLGDKPLWKLFPAEGIMGYFEGNFDETIWREKRRFGQIVNTTVMAGYEINQYEIDKNDPEYRAYREELRIKTIDKICERYPAYLFDQLQETEKYEIINSLQKCISSEDYGLLEEDSFEL